MSGKPPFDDVDGLNDHRKSSSRGRESVESPEDAPSEARWRFRDADRPNAMLTSTQRDTLCGVTDLAENAKRKQLSRMRNRVRNSILDFVLLVEYLDNDEYRLLFEPEKGKQSGEEWDEARLGGVRAMVEFVYEGMKATGHDFEVPLYAAVAAAERRNGWEADVRFSVERHSADADEYPLPPKSSDSDDGGNS